MSAETDAAQQLLTPPDAVLEMAQQLGMDAAEHGCVIHPVLEITTSIEPAVFGWAAAILKDGQISSLDPNVRPMLQYGLDSGPSPISVGVLGQIEPETDRHRSNRDQTLWCAVTVNELGCPHSEGTAPSWMLMSDEGVAQAALWHDRGQVHMGMAWKRNGHLNVLDMHPRPEHQSVIPSRVETPAEHPEDDPTGFRGLRHEHYPLTRGQTECRTVGRDQKAADRPIAVLGIRRGSPASPIIVPGAFEPWPEPWPLDPALRRRPTAKTALAFKHAVSQIRPQLAPNDVPPAPRNLHALDLTVPALAGQPWFLMAMTAGSQPRRSREGAEIPS